MFAHQQTNYQTIITVEWKCVLCPMLPLYIYRIHINQYLHSVNQYLHCAPTECFKINLQIYKKKVKIIMLRFKTSKPQTWLYYYGCCHCQPDEFIDVLYGHCGSIPIHVNLNQCILSIDNVNDVYLWIRRKNINEWDKVFWENNKTQKNFCNKYKCLADGLHYCYLISKYK